MATEHLADGGSLLGLLGVELEAVELGHPVHHLGHAFPEGVRDRPRESPVSLDRSWRSAGGHRLGVQSQLGHDGGPRPRVL